VDSLPSGVVRNRAPWHFDRITSFLLGEAIPPVKTAYETRRAGRGLGGVGSGLALQLKETGIGKVV